MTNGDRFRECTNGMLASVWYNLNHTAIYSEERGRRLLNIKDNLSDFFLWLNKESDYLDDYIFETKMNKVQLLLVDQFGNSDDVTVQIPAYEDDEYIKSLFFELFGVHYDANYCFWTILDD